MDIELKILYLHLIIILLLGFSNFYAAFNIQKKKGVIVEKFSPILLLIPTISIFQFYLQMIKLELDPIYSTAPALIFVILLFLFNYLFWYKRRITVYDIKLEEVIAIIESELTTMSIPFDQKEGFHSEEIAFSLNDEGSKIIIVGGILGEERKTYSLTFKKWRVLQQIEDLHFNLETAFREKQGEKVFWTQILINCSLGLACNLFVIYFFVKLYHHFVL